jgi:hypothetical protein
VNKRLALAIAVIGGLALAWWGSKTPTPLGPQAPAQLFSAGRAMVDDRVIARVPHPVGSPANAAVRDYLVGRMRVLGLDPQVQRTLAFQRSPRSPEPFVMGATVENITGVLPGRDRAAPALAILAHYDSVPASPGAADDAAGVSSALEVLRILKARGAPARDVLLVITDGEEQGLLGAVGFFRDHPLAGRVGFVINMEARGGGGQVQMFQTGPDNGQVIDLFARTAVRPTASSLTGYIYEHMPNDTDFTVSRADGITGLNFAFIGRQFDYHSPSSTSDALDQGSVQHMGDQVTPTALALAFDPALPGKSANLVYANTLAGHMLAYPTWGGWVALALSAALIGLGAWRARKAFAAVDLARGAGAAVYLALLAAALLRFARRLTGADFGFLEQRTLLAQANRWELALLLIGLGAVLYVAAISGRGRSRIEAILLPLLAGGACSAFGLDTPGLAIGGAGAAVGLITFGRPAGVAGSWTGLLLSALVVGIAAQVLAPATGFLIAWPLAVAALGGALSGMGAVRPPWATLALGLLGLPGVGWVLIFAHGAYLGLDLVELLVLPAWLVALLLWPLAQTEEDEGGPRALAFSLLVLGVLVAAVVRIVPPWTERHPRATMVSYAVDLDHGRASRISATPDLPPWAEKVLRADGGRLSRITLPVVSRRPLWAADAMPVPAAGPTATLTRQADGSLLLRMVPPPGARILDFDLRSKVAVSDTTLDGRPVKLLDRPGQWSRFRFAAVPDGVSIGFRAAGPGEIEARYASVTEAWPAAARPLPPRDSRTMAFDTSDSTTAYGSRRLTW